MNIKVLTADDEAWECEAIEKMLHQRFPEVKVIPSVYDGIALMRKVEEEKPDIVIVDVNMPGLTGLEALEQLRMKNYNMEIIIHTAYSEFDYIHKALKLGASDFLVKPVFEENFARSFSAVLQKTEEKYQKARRHFGFRPEVVDNVLEDNIMMSLLMHRSAFEDWKLLNEKEKLPGECGIMIVIQAERQEVLPEIAGILKRRLDAHGRCMALSYQEVCYCCLLSMEFSGEDMQEKVSRWLPGLLHELELKFETVLSTGVSGYKQKLSSLENGVGEAVIALQNDTGTGLCFYNGQAVGAFANPFKGKAGQLARILTSGNDAATKGRGVSEENRVEANCRAAVGFLADCLKADGLEWMDFARYFYGMELLVDVAAFLNMEKRRTGAEWGLPARVRRITEQRPGLLVPGAAISCSEFRSDFSREIKKLEEHLRRPLRQENVYTEQAVIFLEKYYQKDNLSLDQTAETLGISQFYLNRLLKQDRNQTFLEILTEIRITHAIQFLLEPERTAQNVSSMVGYNVKYFYQVFKNTTGLTQKEFRTLMFPTYAH